MRDDTRTSMLAGQQPDMMLSGREEGYPSRNDLEISRLEMSHRIKNMMAVIQFMARQTLKNASDPEDFAWTFQRRLAGYLANFNLLNESDTDQIEIGLVVEHELKPLMDREEGRVRMAGPSGLLSEKQAKALGMVIQELSLNALKYGALSNETGYIEIAWQIVDEAISFQWSEHDGPPVVAPGIRHGFGTRLIDLSARDVVRQFELGGLRVQFTLDPVCIARTAGKRSGFASSGGSRQDAWP